MNEINQIQNAKTPPLLKVDVPTVHPHAHDDSPSDPSASASVRGADRVEVSDAGAALAEASIREAAALEAAVRVEKVAKIRSDIQNGTYDVNGRLELVVDGLIDDITKT